MEASFSITNVEYPLTTRIGVLFTVIYTIWCLIALIRRRSARPAFLTSIPFLVCVPITWWAYVNVLRGMALGGGGRVSTAAGFAEALTILAIGAIAAAVLATLASIRGPRESHAHASAAAVVIHATLAGLTIWFARAVSDRTLGLRLLQQLSPTIILLAAGMVALSCALLMRRLRVSPVAIAVVMTIIVFVTRAQAGAFVSIAMGR